MLIRDDKNQYITEFIRNSAKYWEVRILGFHVNHTY